MSIINSLILQTHSYDKKIGTLYKNYKEVDKQYLKHPLSFEECIDDIFDHAKMIIDDARYKNVLRTLELLLSDSHNNYDNLNKIHVHDLLPRTWRFIRLYDLNAILVFLEQLSDIVTSGSCSQGRTTRILQFYEFHITTKDTIYQQCLR